MCVSIVLAANLDSEQVKHFGTRVEDLGRLYGYGIGLGRENLLPGAKNQIAGILGTSDVVFEVHDLPEAHCACDIDDDIRISCKLGKKSKFFDFVSEILAYESIKSISVLFFQEELPGNANVRKQMGGYEQFVLFLNRWNTWQVEGFEPTRQAYFIADSSPLMFTFTEKQHSQ